MPEPTEQPKVEQPKAEPTIRDFNVGDRTVQLTPEQIDQLAYVGYQSIINANNPKEEKEEKDAVTVEKTPLEDLQERYTKLEQQLNGLIQERTSEKQTNQFANVIQTEQKKHEILADNPELAKEINTLVTATFITNPKLNISKFYAEQVEREKAKRDKYMAEGENKAKANIRVKNYNAPIKVETTDPNNKQKKYTTDDVYNGNVLKDANEFLENLLAERIS